MVAKKKFPGRGPSGIGGFGLALFIYVAQEQGLKLPDDLMTALFVLAIGCIAYAVAGFLIGGWRKFRDWRAERRQASLPAPDHQAPPLADLEVVYLHGSSFIGELVRHGTKYPDARHYHLEMRFTNRSQTQRLSLALTLRFDGLTDYVGEPYTVRERALREFKELDERRVYLSEPLNLGPGETQEGAVYFVDLLPHGKDPDGFEGATAIVLEVRDYISGGQVEFDTHFGEPDTGEKSTDDKETTDEFSNWWMQYVPWENGIAISTWVKDSSVPLEEIRCVIVGPPGRAIAEDWRLQYSSDKRTNRFDVIYPDPTFFKFDKEPPGWPLPEGTYRVLFQALRRTATGGEEPKRMDERTFEVNEFGEVTLPEPWASTHVQKEEQAPVIEPPAEQSKPKVQAVTEGIPRPNAKASTRAEPHEEGVRLVLTRKPDDKRVLSALEIHHERTDRTWSLTSNVVMKDSRFSGEEVALVFPRDFSAEDDPPLGDYTYSWYVTTGPHLLRLQRKRIAQGTFRFE